MPLTELIYLIEQSMAQYLASSTYATQTYTLNQLLNELNTNGVSIEFQNILFDTFPGLKWAQPIIQFTGALTRAAWLTIIHDVQEDVYEVEEVATYAEVPVDAAVGAAGAAFGLTFTEEALPSFEEMLRLMGVTPADTVPAGIINEGTEEEPEWKVFMTKDTLEKIRIAMYLKGFFNTGELTVNVPSGVVGEIIEIILPLTLTADSFMALLDKAFVNTGASLGFWNDASKSSMKEHAVIQYAFDHGYNTVRVRVAPYSYRFGCDFYLEFYKIQYPLSSMRIVSRSDSANYISIQSTGALSYDMYSVNMTLHNDGVFGTPTTTEGSTTSILGFEVGMTNTIQERSTVQFLVNSATAVESQALPGVIRQTGAVIPDTEEIDYDVLYPGWETLEAAQLLEDGSVVKYPLYPVALDPTAGYIIDVPQTIAQEGAIDIPDVKEWAESIAKPLVSEKVDYFTRTIAKAIPLAVSIPAGDTPPILIPTDSGSAGLFTVYNPSAANLNDIGSFLWQTSIIDQILQLFGNAYDAVISLHEIYVAPSTSGSSIIKFGNIPATSVGAVPLVNSRYVTFTYPELTVPGLNGNALDYQPYVGISIYLPFIGIQELNANDVMDGTMSVTYVVDVVTGCCIAHLQITKYDSSQLLYSFEGNCAMQLPVTGREHVLKNELSNIGSLITLGATLYAGSGALNAISAGAGFALSAQGQNVQHKSSMSGNAGALSPRKPYLIINHKLPAMAEGYYEVIGGEANERALLSTCEGYTRVLDAHLEGINCTTSERTEIESLLKAGCIF